MTRFKFTPKDKKRWVYIILTLFIATVIFYSCDDEVFAPQSETAKVTKWAPNIKYGVAYNEKKTVLQTTWPGGTVAGFSKKSSDESGGVLIDYSYEHVETTIDDKGYISISSRHLEGGDAWMHMPPDVYNKLKDNMPAKPEDYDPYVASEMRDGQAFLITRNGDVIPSYSYDREEYKVDPSEIDSLLNLLAVDDTTEVEDQIKSRLNDLSSKYGNVDKLNNFLVSLEIASNNNGYTASLSAIKQVVDLRDGTIIREGLVDEQGRISNMSFIRYKKVNGFMFEDYRETFEMVEENGRFFNKYVSYTKRDNIQIYY